MAVLHCTVLYVQYNYIEQAKTRFEFLVEMIPIISIHALNDPISYLPPVYQDV